MCVLRSFAKYVAQREALAIYKNFEELSSAELVSITTAAPRALYTSRQLPYNMSNRHIAIYIQGDTRPTGAVPPRLPVSVRRSATLAKCSALLKGDGSQCPVLLCYCCVQSGMLHV
jgi:hypothetical protein